LGLGQNTRGQLGDGSTTERQMPVAVAGLNEVLEFSAGQAHALARRRDGSVWGWSWDYEDSGELGVAPASAPATATAIAGLGSIQQIAAGNAVSALPREDGHVLMGGKNYIGQLGDGTLAARHSFVLAVNTGADGILKLNGAGASKVAPERNVAFFLVASGAINSKNASVATSTRFYAADVGQAGSVYVLASVPTGTWGTAVPLQKASASGSSGTATRQILASGLVSPSFTLIQRTPAGWQTVMSGQLLPYASGVLADQLAAQTILSNADITEIKGAEFCVGYGSSAQSMLDNGNIRAVATIAGGTAPTSCVPGGAATISLMLEPGWSLLGNTVDQAIWVVDKFGDAARVISVWKWDGVTSNWQFYAPAMTATALQSFAVGQGYSVLSEIKPGEGYWVHAQSAADLSTWSGTAINLRQSSLMSGWNLVATASAVSAQDFNLSLSTTAPINAQVPVNLTSLWAWDAAQSRWYFYAPSLQAQGGSALGDYIASRGYSDFGSQGKTLGNGAGFWVQRASPAP
jgi:hypothetical protein